MSKPMKEAFPGGDKSEQRRMKSLQASDNNVEKQSCKTNKANKDRHPL